MIYALDDNHPKVAPDAWVAPNAVLIGKVVLEGQSSVWFGACARGDNEEIRIGQGSNVQEGCVLHTDMGYPLDIGADCTIGHQAMLHGCTIGAGSLIGMGATLLNGVHIGPGCLIGARSLITEGKTIPAGMLVMGVPAKVIRPLTEEERLRNILSAQGYRANARRFALGLKAVEGRGHNAGDKSA